MSLSAASRNQILSEMKESHRTAYDSTPIPLGGSRVPESMASASSSSSSSDWRSLPEVDSKTEDSSVWGESYVRMESLRHQLSESKKAISALTLSVAAIEKNRALWSSEADEAKKEKISDRIELDGKKVDECCSAVSKFVVEGSPIAASEWKDVIMKILNDCKAAKKPKDFIEWNDYVKLQTAAMFREQAKLLEKMKQIKKEKKENDK